MTKVNNTHKGIWNFLTKVKYVRRITGDPISRKMLQIYYVHFMFKNSALLLVSYYFHLLRFEDGNLGYVISLTW